MLTGATSTVCFSLEGAFFSSKWMLDTFLGGWATCGEEDRDSVDFVLILVVQRVAAESDNLRILVDGLDIVGDRYLLI